MNFLKLSASLAVVTSLFACQAENYDKKEAATISQSVQIEQEEKPREAGFAGDSSLQIPMDEKRKKQPGGERLPKAEWDKKIIKTAILNIEVKDYHAFYNSLREKVRAAGGYVAQEEQNQSDYKIQNSLVIKVPVEEFDATVVQLGSGTEKINEKKISSQDVTAEMFDTKSRMEAKKQVRLRYLELLKQAKNMQEILSVQSEINEIQEDIESATGRIQYLGHSSGFSTIHLTYYQVLNVSANDIGTPAFSTQFGAAFKTGWDLVKDLCIGLVTIWPLFLVVFAAVIVYKRMKLQKPKQA
jgi:hypothetical protein